MPAPFVHHLRVRYHECDAQGIVFNANWLTYFDVTLTEWFREAFGSYGALMEDGGDVVLAETTLRFRGSARFDEDLAVSVEVERLRDDVDGRAVHGAAGRRGAGRGSDGLRVRGPGDDGQAADPGGYVRERLAPYV